MLRHSEQGRVQGAQVPAPERLYPLMHVVQAVEEVQVAQPLGHLLHGDCGARFLK